jgi:hypothetical protein
VKIIQYLYIFRKNEGCGLVFSIKCLLELEEFPNGDVMQGPGPGTVCLIWYFDERMNLEFPVWMNG